MDSSAKGGVAADPPVDRSVVEAAAARGEEGSAGAGSAPSSFEQLRALQDQLMVELRSRVRQEQFETWFRGVRVGRADDHEFELVVPTGFLRDWITRNYLQQVQEAVQVAVRGVRNLVITVGAPAVANTPAFATRQDESDTASTASSTGPSNRPEDDLPTEDGTIVGAESSDSTTDVVPSSPAAGSSAAGHPGGVAPQVDMAVGQAERRHAKRASADETADAASSASPQTTSDGESPPPQPAPAVFAPRSPQHRAWDSSLNKNYTFKEFVVGPSNQLAHAAALAIGSNPGQAYNPFFVHGNVGLGKTHLLQAICHAILRAHPHYRVIYLSCEEFTNRYILSLQNQSLESFRDYHRSADVLVIDDVEFLANKTQTQLEFFHTFNTLYNLQKQIVLSSDRRPPDIPTLEDRLVSRFKWGLETSMELPCFETRVAIVKRKGLIRSLELPDDVAHYIAERVVTNIRELEGAVTKVLGIAAISGQPITRELAEDALQGATRTHSHKIALADIMALITGEFSITAKDVTGKSRTQAVSLPRQIGMYLARQYTDHSLEEVGRFFGNRDHTTVLYAVGKIKKRVAADRMFEGLLDDLGRRLGSAARQAPRGQGRRKGSSQAHA